MSSRAGGIMVSAVLMLVAVAAPAVAQEASASIAGQATDVSGLPVAGVTVIAQAPELISELSTTTDATGRYGFPMLPSGSYVITYMRSTFVTVKRTVRLSAGETVTAHVIMRAANGFEEAVTVIHERLTFPPSNLTFVDPRTASRSLPVSGTLRSVFSLATELPSVRPGESRLFFDGMPLHHGWRTQTGAALAGPGPETIREIALSPAWLPAGVGQLTTGVVSLVTTSGARRFSGSIRADVGSAGIGADELRTSQAVDAGARSLEYTAAGSVGNRPIWFMASGRHVTESIADDTAFTDERFERGVGERFGTARLTYARPNGQRFEAQWVGGRQQLDNATPVTGVRVAELSALETRILSDRAVSASFSGWLGDRLHVAARYTRENGTLTRSAIAEPSSAAGRVPIVDQQTGVIAWASDACTACDPHRTIHDTVRVTAGGLLPGRWSSHLVEAGLDLSRDVTLPATHPDGGSFRLFAARFDTTTGSVLPVFLPGGSSWIGWLPDNDNRPRLRGAGFFVHDRWAARDNLTIDLGLRVDRRRAVRSADGLPLLDEQLVSPRLAARWRPGAQPWTLDAAFGRYGSAASDLALDASFAIHPSQRAFIYDGAPINQFSPTTPASDAIVQVFDWFQSGGGVARPAWLAVEPGVSTTAAKTIRGPRVDERSIGFGREIGEDGFARVDLTWRSYNGFIARRVTAGSQPAIDSEGRAIDAGTRVVDDRLNRRYAGVTVTADYRFGHWADVGARYTLSSLRGTADDTTIAGDFPVSSALAYPGFTEPDWNTPAGALPDDARHRARVWMHSELLATEARGTLMLSFLISAESGRPYGAAGLVAVAPFVPTEGLQNPPVAARYYFTARDAFRTSMLMRADVGLSYRRRLAGTVHGELFFNVDVLNVTGKTAILHPERLTVVRTAFTDPGLQPFNPFTDTPIEGVHWTFDDSNAHKDTAGESLARTMGRALRVAFGIRY